MTRLYRSIIIVFLLSPVLQANALETPEAFLGHAVGADYKLARWERIIDYFQRVGDGSDRVLVEEIGRSTEDAPYIMATISTPETLNNLDRYKQLQRWLSHPDEIPAQERDSVLVESKSVVLINCSLHSNEIGASQMSMELLYNLASGDDERTQEILDNCIILLVPSANPDGINKIIDWYERSLGTPWEGRSMPWLYQKYTGHDNNRDWFMVTQQETRILNHVLYHEWYPSIVYDIHQMGNSGVRFFVPPFFDPMNPNIHPLIAEQLKAIGGRMSTELASAGKAGVANYAIYDMWWHGGARTAPYRHNMIGILSEAASPRMASPIFQHESELRGHGRGLSEYQQKVFFTNPWQGGWWRLRDVVEYELIACQALFTYASRYREEINENYIRMGESAIQAGKSEPPFAFLVPPDQRDLPTAARMLETLWLGGVQVHEALEPFDADGIRYPAGTAVIYAAQPYRNHILDLLEPQDYPVFSLSPGAPAEPPYDIAGWSLPHQMGVETIPVQMPFEANAADLERIEPPTGRVDGQGPVFVSANQTTNDFILINRSWRQGIPVFLAGANQNMPGAGGIAEGSLVFQPGSSEDIQTLSQWAAELGLALNRTSLSRETLKPLNPVRVGLYQPWTSSMDEGWTRFTLEQFEFDFVTVRNAHIRAGRLNDRYDVIILPDIGVGTLMNGRSDTVTALEYAGGIGEAGAAHLQAFVEQGGALLCMDSSSQFAISYLGLPVSNALSGLSQDEFFCPGSVLRIRVDESHPLGLGMPNVAGAFFARSYAFELETGNRDASPHPDIGAPQAAAVYDNTIPLLSGWIRGADRIKSKAAIVSVPYGKGSVALYGFRVQHRAQTHGAFRLLFNGIVHGTD